jgi:hypothetical protein
MSKIKGTLKAAVATATVALGVAALAPGTAQAAAYGNQCGAGYGAGSVRNISGGSIYLARNGSWMCAVTILDNPGPPAVSMSVWIRRSGTTTWISDPGMYNRYAGPVYAQTWGCADYGGRIGTSQTTAYDVCW